MNEPTSHPVPADEGGGYRPPPGLSGWGRFWFWLKFWLYVKTARLRFILVLVAVGGLIAYWDTLKAYYEKMTRPLFGDAQAAADSEFFCPMHPEVITEKPSKCPLCGMPLSKRKLGEKQEAEALPAGVLRRVQLSPYKIAAAGIQTTELRYRPLMREIRTLGFVEFDETRVARISIRLPGRTRIDELKVNVTGTEVKKGQPLAVIYNPELAVTVETLLGARAARKPKDENDSRQRLEQWGITGEQIDDILRVGKPVTQMEIRSPIHGHVIRKYQWQGENVEEGARLYDVADLSMVWVEAQVYEEDLPYLKAGMPVTATTKAFPNRELAGRIDFVWPHLDAGTRTLRVRLGFENRHGHELPPGMHATVKLHVAATEMTAFPDAVREALWQANVADSVARLSAGAVGPAADASLRPLLHAATRLALYSRGVAVAVPDTAVIDTGTRRIVYRQSEPGVFDGLSVELGPRSSDGYYPVLRGLEAGDIVVTTGSFHIDAETRLNPSVGSTYFGAGGAAAADRSGGQARPSMLEDENAKVKMALARLSPADRRLAEQQEYCPVMSHKKLGSMGIPVKVFVQGEPFFLCCSGCEDTVKRKPEETLSRARELRQGKGRTPPVAHPKGHEDAAAEADIRKNLAKLSEAGRKLAQAQRFCAINTTTRLGRPGDGRSGEDPASESAGVSLLRRV